MTISTNTLRVVLLYLTHNLLHLCVSSSRSEERWSRRGEANKNWLSRIASFTQTNPRLAWLWRFFHAHVKDDQKHIKHHLWSLVVVFLFVAPVDLWEGSFCRALPDYNTGKSINGWVGFAVDGTVDKYTTFVWYCCAFFSVNCLILSF